MPALYKAGESVGPGTVLEDTFTVNADGTSVEHVVFSWGQTNTMYAVEEPAEWHSVRPREPGEKILVPYTIVHPLTVESLPPTGVGYVDVSGHRFDYWRVLCDWWGGDDLTIVEHDVAAHPGVFDSFRACPEPWCVFPYDNHSDADAEAWRNMLGCTRFRKEMMDAVPRAAIDVEERWRDWHYTCDGIGKNLRDAGFTHHWHSPAVNHHRMLDRGGVVAAMEAR